MCEPPALAPQDSNSMINYYSGQYKTSLQSCALNIKSTYLTIEKEYISAGDYSIRIDMPNSKNAINKAITCIQQYRTTTTSVNGGWINLGKLQTCTRSYHMKMESLLSEGDVTQEAHCRKIQCIIVIC